MKTMGRGATCLALTAASTVTLLAQGTKELVLPTLALTGCIAAAPARAGGGSDPPSTSSADRYVLTKAAVAPSTDAAQPAANQPKPPTATQFRLNGPDSMLAPYVAHQVEVSGRIEEPATRPASAANMPTLKVDAVRMLAPSCP
jgi:hypothetical protein